MRYTSKTGLAPSATKKLQRKNQVNLNTTLPQNFNSVVYKIIDFIENIWILIPLCM